MENESTKHLETYKCRRCRVILARSTELDEAHDRNQDCSCLFLELDKAADWISDAVKQAGWTNGKLRCPKCSSRIGGFNFVSPIPCKCNKQMIPAVWFVKRKLDEIDQASFAMPHCSNGDRILRTTVPNSTVTLSKSTDNTCFRRKQGSFVSKRTPNTTTGTFADVTDITSSQGVCMQQSPVRCSGSDRSTVLAVNECECTVCHAPPSLVPYQSGEEKEPLAAKLNPCECRRGCNSQLQVVLCTGNDAACHNHEHFCLHQEMKEIKKELSKLKSRPRAKDPIHHDPTPTTDDAASKLADIEISGQHQCPVCLDLLYDPFETPCQHVFCSPCLKQLHHASNGRPLCPLCRQPVHFVRTRLDLMSELRAAYALLYRVRHRFESCRPCRLWPLPSPSNTNFPMLLEDDEHMQPPYHPLYQRRRHRRAAANNDTSYMWLLLADTLSTIKLVLLLVCHLLLLLVFHQDSVTAHNSNRSVRRSAQRIALLLFTLTITVVLVVAGGALVVFAFDFVKLALILAVCYAGLVKIIIAFATERN